MGSRERARPQIRPEAQPPEARPPEAQPPEVQPPESQPSLRPESPPAREHRRADRRDETDGLGDRLQAPFVTPAPEMPAFRLSPPLAARLGEAARLERLPTPTDAEGREDDDAIARRVDLWHRTMVDAARLRPAGPLDLLVMLTLVCGRLRAELDPDDVEHRLTYLLAESARDGVVMSLLAGHQA